MSDFILPPIEIVDDSMRRSERVLHNSLLDFLRETYPRMDVDSEPYWGPGVGRPDIVCYTDMPSGLGLLITIIEVKRPIASDGAVRQLGRYMFHAARWLMRTGHPGNVTGILAAPRLRLERVRLSEQLLFQPLSVTYR